MSQEHDDDGAAIRPLRTAGTSTPQMITSAPAGAAVHGEDALSLRIGTRLGEFEITRRLGEGGFSIVYLALDHSLERTVALKEYMPSSLATRLGTTQVQPRSQRLRDTFDLGLNSFVNEARLLASFDHPALVKVYRFWEANGTAYMAMPFYQGVTLKEAVRSMPQAPDEEWLLKLLGPLTEALMVIHAQRCFHRDIAPDNVILLAGSDKPMLLDFGAARRVIGDVTQGLTVILKAGYAPVEQYAEIPGMKQGSWTDVYALAAVVYWAITGSTPPSSVGRMMSDSYVALSQCAAGRYSAGFLQAIDQALVVLPDRRTQTIEALRRDLGLSGPSLDDAPTLPGWQDPEATVIRSPGQRSLPSTFAHTGTPTVPVSAARPVVPTQAPTHAPTQASRGPDLEAPADERTVMPPRREAANAMPREHRAPVGSEPAIETASGSRRGSFVVATILALAIAGAGAAWWAKSQRSAPQAASEDAARAVPAPDKLPGSVPASAAALLPAAHTPSTDAATNAATNASTPTETTAQRQPQLEPAHPSTPAIAAPETVESVAEPPPPSDTAPRPRSQPEPATTPPARKPSTGQVGGGAQRGESSRAARVHSESANSAECARVMERISLGDSSPQLVERMAALDCR